MAVSLGGWGAAPGMGSSITPKSSSTSSKKSSSSITTKSSGSSSGRTYTPITREMWANGPNDSSLTAATDYQSGQKASSQQQQLLEQQRLEQEQQERINQLKEAQRASKIAALDSAKNSALTALDTERDNISPTYYDKRNQAAAASDVGAMNFANYMAARGIKGAAGAMPEIYRNAGLQGQIGALDQQEASDLSAIEKQRANIETNYASDVAAAESEIEAQAMQASIDQYNADRAYALQQAASNLEAIKYATAQTKDKTDTEKSEWISTIGQYDNDYAAQINALQNDNDTSNDWQIAYLQAARNNKLATQQAAADKAAQQEIENEQKWAQINKTGGSGGGGSSITKGNAAKSSAYDDVTNAINNGTKYQDIRNNIIYNAAGYKAYGVDYQDLLKYLDSVYDPTIRYAEYVQNNQNSDVDY